MTKIWFNGKICADDKVLSVNDRGFLLGEALFETILIKKAAPQFWDAHIERLLASCAVFGFHCPYDKPVLAQAAQDLIATNTTDKNQILRISVSNGAGGRGLAPSSTDNEPSWVMQLSPTSPIQSPIKLHISTIMRLADQTISNHKTTNYFANILARREALAHNADEAVLCNQYGRIACAASASIFIKKDNMLITPPLKEGALNGVIRKILLTKPTLPIPIKEADIAPDDLHQSDIILLANSVIEVQTAYINTLPSNKKAEALASALIKEL